jgi:hypothetical protein
MSIAAALSQAAPQIEEAVKEETPVSENLSVSYDGPKFDATPKPWKWPKAAVAPEREFRDITSGWFAYEPSASLDDAENNLKLFKGMGPFSKAYANMPAELRPQALALMQTEAERHAGVASKDWSEILKDTQAKIDALMGSRPQPQAMGEDRRKELLDAQFPQLPDRPQYDAEQLAMDAVFALAATRMGANPAQVLAQIVQTRRAAMNQQHEDRLRQAEIGSQRASMEMRLESSDIESMNQYAEQVWKEKLNLAMGDQRVAQQMLAAEEQDREQLEARYVAANTVGEKLYFAQKLGIPESDAGLQADIKAMKDKEARAEKLTTLQTDRETRLLENSVADDFNQSMERELKQFGELKDPQEWERRREGLINLHGKEFADRLDLPAGGPTLQKQREARIAKNASERYKLAEKNTLMRWIKLQADIEAKENQIARLQQTGGKTGSASRQTAILRRQEQIAKQEVDASEFEAQAASLKTQVETLEKTREQKKKEMKAEPDYMKQKAVQNEIARLNTEISDMRKAMASADAKAKGAKAGADKLIGAYGKDGTLGLPDEIEPSQVQDYARPDFKKYLEALRKNPPVAPVQVSIPDGGLPIGAGAITPEGVKITRTK